MLGRLIRARLEFQMLVPGVSDAEDDVHNARGAFHIKSRILRQDIAKQSGTAPRQTGDEIVILSGMRGTLPQFALLFVYFSSSSHIPVS